MPSRIYFTTRHEEFEIQPASSQKYAADKMNMSERYRLNDMASLDFFIFVQDI